MEAGIGHDGRSSTAQEQSEDTVSKADYGNGDEPSPCEDDLD
jgi:hypothetical protein